MPFNFTMAFQPIVDLSDCRIDGYEALVRGPAGEGAEFVLDQVTAEHSYAFDQAVRVRAIELAARLGLDRQLSINFLPGAVYEPTACIQATLQAARRSGFPLDRLTFELLETQAVGDTLHMRTITTAYRSYGFKIALDDFGVGFSGLTRLIQLEPDIVKIDRALGQDCDLNRTKLAVIAGVVMTCAEIGVKVVVEGVERAGEVRALQAVGVRFVQGFYFGEPAFERLIPDDAVSWVWD